ncbi:hypothetical protein FACS189483_05710 [Spirochaetia bacterium]|nr:hypothetical protein FACS189483_05710 [Spirochaetia bacterium]
MRNKLTGFIALLALVLAGCALETPGEEAYYKVEILPSTDKVVLDEAGVDTTITPTAYSEYATGGTWNWKIDGGRLSGTNFDSTGSSTATGNTLTFNVDGLETKPIKVTAEYASGTRPGAATFEIGFVSRPDAITALRAIGLASNADALLAALKNPNTGLSFRVKDSAKELYWDDRGNFQSAVNSLVPTSNVGVVRAAVDNVRARFDDVTPINATSNNDARHHLLNEMIQAIGDAAGDQAKGAVFKGYLTEDNLKTIFGSKAGYQIWDAYDVLSDDAKTAFSETFHGSTFSFTLGDVQDYLPIDRAMEFIDTIMSGEGKAEDFDKLDSFINIGVTVPINPADVPAINGYIKGTALWTNPATVPITLSGYTAAWKALSGVQKIKAADATLTGTAFASFSAITLINNAVGAAQ